MEIMNKKRKNYVYLFADRNKKEAFYYDEKAKCFYRIKTEPFDMKHGFMSLFLAPLNLILARELSINLWSNFFIACISGLIIGYFFLFIVNKQFFKHTFVKVDLTSKEFELSLHNLKEVFKMKCVLIISWGILFLIALMMYLTETTYKSLIIISIIFMFLYPLLNSINYIQYKRVEKFLSQLIIHTEKD